MKSGGELNPSRDNFPGLPQSRLKLTSELDLIRDPVRLGC
jgi:hypothetical protein